jgi:hypothetical protein
VSPTSAASAHAIAITGKDIQIIHRFNMSHLFAETLTFHPSNAEHDAERVSESQLKEAESSSLRVRRGSAEPCAPATALPNGKAGGRVSRRF